MMPSTYDLRAFSIQAFRACFVLFAVAIGCVSKVRIPGTDIPDTAETRAVIEAVEHYRVAFVRKDAAAVLALAHPSYYDEAGTDDPSDDVSYKQLGALLRRRLTQIDAIRFIIDYVEIHVDGDRAIARAWIDASFRMKPILAPDGTPREQAGFTRKQDYVEYELLREKSVWRIVRGF